MAKSIKCEYQYGEKLARLVDFSFIFYYNISKTIKENKITMPKCCVCGQDNEELLGTYTSTLTKQSNIYCNLCILSGFEPYEDLINFRWDYDMFNDTFKRKILNPTLIREGKTIKQFNEDVANKRKENKTEF